MVNRPEENPVSMTQAVSPTLLDRLRNLRTLWRDIAGSGREAVAPDLPDEDAELLREQMQSCLEGKGGEGLARARAAQLGRTYLGLNRQGRIRFLTILASEFDTDAARVDAAMARVATASDPQQRRAAERDLRQALEAPRVRLLTQFNALPEGVKFLVDMRAELLELRQYPELAGLEADLKALLASWFDIGFLELRRLTWRSPAAVLEKIIAYEAVHTIESWQDLKDRLDSDRRLYAFFHPRMPEEPLIFVEVALVRGMAASIHDLLDEDAPVGDPANADAAIFYSISNAQKGLAGISFGNFLIKRVAEVLAGEFPNLRTFATLSPIPGFRVWLEQLLAKEDGNSLSPPDLRALAAVCDDPVQALQRAVAGTADWMHDEALVEALKAPLLRLCARYLSQAKRNGHRALDAVAHFHLSNGARMERLNWLADTSPKGLRESVGIMINYLYKLADIEANHEAYTGQGRVAMSAGVRALLK